MFEYEECLHQQEDELADVGIDEGLVDTEWTAHHVGMDLHTHEHEVSDTKHWKHTCIDLSLAALGTKVNSSGLLAV